MKADGSGFMTQKEKEWVVKVQLLQLQDKDPSNDDYYYQVWLVPDSLLEFIPSPFLPLPLPLSILPSLPPSLPVSLSLLQNYIQQKARRETSTSAPSSLSLPHVSREEKKYRSVLLYN